MVLAVDSIAGGRIFYLDPTTNNGKLDPAKGEDPKSHTFDEAIDIVGFGSTGWQVFLVSALIMLAVINETMGISILIPASHCDLNLSATDKGVLTGVSFAGIILTSHLWGYVADTKGRKNVIVLSLVITTLCSLVSSMAVNFTTIAVMRLLVGMSISAPSATIYAYLGEFTKTEKRTVVISFASVAVGLSYVFTGTFGWIVLSFDWRINILDLVEFRPWRLLFIIYSLPGAIGAIWLMFLPESPKFYISRGRDDKALEILRNMYVENHPGDSEDDFPVKRFTPECNETVDCMKQDGCLSILASMWNQTVPLFKPPNLLYFSVCCVLQFGMFVVSAGMGLWYPEIVNRVTKSNGNDSATICEVLRGVETPEEDLLLDLGDMCNDHVTSDVFVYVIALGSIYTFLYLAISTMLQKFSRGYILVINLLISGASGVLLVFINEPYCVLVLFCSFMVFAGISISIVNGAAVSLFPTSVRAMAVCLSLMMGRLGSVVGTNMIGLIMEENCNLTFILFGGCSLLGAALAFILPSR